MSITKKVINNNEYEFVNHSRSNRSGFVHETELYRNNVLIGKYKVQYYNRTWECYQFQSVMRGILYNLMNESLKRFKANYKAKHNIKRLTKAKEAEMMLDFAENKSTLHADLQELYKML